MSIRASLFCFRLFAVWQKSRNCRVLIVSDAARAIRRSVVSVVSVGCARVCSRPHARFVDFHCHSLTPSSFIEPISPRIRRAFPFGVDCMVSGAPPLLPPVTIIPIFSGDNGRHSAAIARHRTLPPVKAHARHRPHADQPPMPPRGSGQARYNCTRDRPNQSIQCQPGTPAPRRSRPAAGSSLQKRPKFLEKSSTGPECAEA